MATVNKDFRVKNGLIVEGTTATVNGSNVLTEASTTFLNNIIKDQSGDLLANATLTNITISYDSETNALSITAENGVGDSTTDDLSEGSTNLYFTDERAQDAFGALVANGSYSGATVTYNDETNSFNISVTDQFPSHDTDDLAEGSTNLYFTDARAQAAVAQDITDAIDAVDTDDIEEGATNLYFTDQRALDATSSAYDAAGSAATAEANANNYTDGRETAITTAYQSYADQAEADAISTASADATSKANTAESNANTYTDDLIGDATVDGTAGNTVTDRIGTAISNLVGGAPELLDTLDEIAAAIADDENFSTTVVSDIAQGLTDAKAYTDTRETAITTAYQSYADTAESDAIATAAADATAKADAAEADAISAAAADATSKANAAQAAAEATASADATSKANTAESNANTFTTNSIDALDTDDIEEGATNLYFTDTRAVDALEAVVPNFTEVDVNSVATQVASTSNLADTSQAAVYSFAHADYRSAKFLVKAANGSHTEMSEVLVTLDTSDNIAITEYAVIGTNGSLGAITAGINGTDVELLYTAQTADTDVSVFGTLIA